MILIGLVGYSIRARAGTMAKEPTNTVEAFKK
jgi:hypothetical protein